MCTVQVKMLVTAVITRTTKAHALLQASAAKPKSASQPVLDTLTRMNKQSSLVYKTASRRLWIRGNGKRIRKKAIRGRDATCCLVRARRSGNSPRADPNRARPVWFGIGHPRRIGSFFFKVDPAGPTFINAEVDPDFETGVLVRAPFLLKPNQVLERTHKPHSCQEPYQVLDRTNKPPSCHEPTINNLATNQPGS